MTKTRRYINVFLITCSVLVWNMPYIATMFYEQFQAAYDLTNTQIGLLISAFGIISTPAYMLGGYVADRFSCRKCVACSCFGTALLGIIAANAASFSLMMVVYILYGVTVTLMQWSAFLKLLLAQSGSPAEEGRVMGFFEFSSGVVNVAFAYGILAFLGKIIDKIGFSGVLYAYAGFLTLIGIVLLAMIREPERSASNSFSIRMVPQALKHPGTWFQALVVLGGYMITNAATYMNPYLTQVFGVSGTFAVGFAIIARYGRNAMGVIGGAVKDRTGRTSTVIYIFNGFACLMSLAILFVPQAAEAKIFAIVIMTLAILSSGCGRPTLYTPIPECGVPMVYTGTAIGIASAIGYSGDLWYYVICGSWLDKYGNAGYQRIFAFIAAGLLLTIITAAVMQRWLNKNGITCSSRSKETPGCLEACETP